MYTEKDFHYARCKCISPDHLVQFVFDKEFKEVFISVQLRPDNNIFRRVWAAIKYIFGYTSRYGHWDCTLLDKENTEALYNWIGEHLKEMESDG